MNPAINFSPPDLSGVDIEQYPDIPLPRPSNEFWVFAYGSLMWNPGFEFEEAVNAELKGHHRSLCVWSVHYRGTPENPGLVLGLDQGGSCLGRAYRVTNTLADETLLYLREREMITGVYQPILCHTRLADARSVEALTFVVKPPHPQYAGKLTTSQVAAVVRDACGKRGANCEYVLNTKEQLKSLGMRDNYLQEVSELLPR